MNKKGFVNIILIVVAVLVIGGVSYFALVKKSGPVTEQPTPTGETKLTKQEIIDFTIGNIDRISPIKAADGKELKVKYIGFTSDKDAYVEYTNGVPHKILSSYTKGSIKYEVGASYELALSEKNKGIDWKLVQGEDIGKREPIIHEWDTGEMVDIEVYFIDSEMAVAGTGAYWDMVRPFVRTVPNRSAIARIAIEELLKGPTPEEARKYSTSFPNVKHIIDHGIARGTPYSSDHVQLLSLKIEGGTAFVDFSEELRAYGGGSAWVSTLEAQIKKTLLQFANVVKVEILIEGKTDDVLQP